MNPFRSARMYIWDILTNLWQPVSAVNPVPVTTAIINATDGQNLPPVTLAIGVEGQLVAANPNRIAFLVFNLGPGQAMIAPRTPTQPAINATANHYPLIVFDRLIVDDIAELEWRVFANLGAIDVRVLEIFR